MNNLKKNAFSVGFEFKFSFNKTFKTGKYTAQKMTDGFKIRDQIMEFIKVLQRKSSTECY